MVSTIAIVGAGPAGTSLAIRLATAGFGVTLIEREKFPREKLCGEFISPECLDHFETLGVADRMLSSGGDMISETIFYERGGRHVSIPSEWFGSSGALSLSRAQMDLCLLDRAKEVGVDVREESRLVDVERDDERISWIGLRGKDRKQAVLSADVFIDATGRSASLCKLVNPIPIKKSKPPYVAFKTHLRGIDMEKGRCEIYSFPGGYGGLSYVEGGVANLCFLMRADFARKYGGKGDPILADVIMTNQRAAMTLKSCEMVYDWLAVTVDRFGRKELSPAANAFAVGDAAAFIDPFTGSGMLLAFETAALLADMIDENRHEPAAISDAYARAFDHKFTSRLRTGRLVRHVAFTPSLTGAAIRVLNTSRWARALLTRATRQNFSISQDS